MSILRNEVNKILKGIKEGDVSKQQELIESTCNFLKVISYKYLYNKDDVEDVVMEAYMKVYRSIDSCDLSLDGYNWICKIVENTAYDFNAEYAKNHKVEKALVVTEDFTDIEDAIADKDEVLRIMKVLPLMDQRLLYLKFWRNMSYAEIVEHLSMKKSNVHKRIQKILKEIHKKFGKPVDDIE